MLSKADPRIRNKNDRPVNPNGEYVLYFCQAQRRMHDNLALEYAIERANELQKPVLVYESIRTDYPFANDRLHQFMLECARDNELAAAKRQIPYAFFLPKNASESVGMMRRLLQSAVLLVTDASPIALVRAHNEALQRFSPCAIFTVDDNIIVPLSHFDKHEPAARTIRSKYMKELPNWLKPLREERLFVNRIKGELPFVHCSLQQENLYDRIQECAINHRIYPVVSRVGGHQAARTKLANFLRSKAAMQYEQSRDLVDEDGTSGMSPYLHFGAISARQMALSIQEAPIRNEAKNAILEQLLVRRALAFNHCETDVRFRTYAAVPSWAQTTLHAHRTDKRTELASITQLESADSNDPIWNAAQRQLLTTGWMHNILRMYWGKRLIEMMSDPENAFDFAVRMFDMYALDGRDPNTYAGIGWCFGLHDQPFPEREIFGQVRPMGQGALKRRFDVKGWLTKCTSQTQLF